MDSNFDETIDDDLLSEEIQKKKKKTAKVGSGRGVETLFRNSYRSQLDMIALAATKANIMISLNGLLLSILFLSGTYLLDVQPMMVVPFVSLVLTCLVAVVCAVLAARPVMDLKRRPFEDFRKDRADLLIFEQYASLTKGEYIEAMMEMLESNDRVYRAMVAHLHHLGQTADLKFRRLRQSYNAFVIGLVISVALLAFVTLNGLAVGR